MVDMNNWSPAGLVVDFYDDIQVDTIRNHEKLAEQLNLYDVECLDGEELNKLSDNDFALIIETSRRRLRKYPVHDVGHAKLAAVYLLSFGDNLPVAARNIATANIKLAMKRFIGEIVPDYKNVYRVYDDNSKAKVASINSEWALIKEGKKTKKYYPCGTPWTCERSMGHFEENGMGMSPSDRRKIAVVFGRKAQEFELATKPDGLIERYSATDWNPNIKSCLTIRKQAVDYDYDACRILDELAENIYGFTKEAAVKLLETFDSYPAYNLDRLWGKTNYPDPYLSVYGKENSKVSYDVKGLGKIDASDIKKIAESNGLLEEIVGKEGAEMFREDPEAVFNSLPIPTQTYLIQKVRE